MYLCIFVSMYLCIHVSMYLCIYVSRFYVSNGGSAGNVTITKCSLRQGEDMKKQRVSQCPVKIATSPLSLPTQYNKVS